MKAMSFGKQHYQIAAKTQTQAGPEPSTHHLPPQHSYIPNVCTLLPLSLLFIFQATSSYLPKHKSELAIS